MRSAMHHYMTQAQRALISLHLSMTIRSRQASLYQHNGEMPGRTGKDRCFWDAPCNTAYRVSAKIHL